jgi:hypothetical protein
MMRKFEELVYWWDHEVVICCSVDNSRDDYFISKSNNLNYFLKISSFPSSSIRYCFSLFSTHQIWYEIIRMDMKTKFHMYFLMSMTLILLLIKFNIEPNNHELLKPIWKHEGKNSWSSHVVQCKKTWLNHVTQLHLD